MVKVLVERSRVTHGERMPLTCLAVCCFIWLALRLLLFRKHTTHVKTMAVLGSGAVLAMSSRLGDTVQPNARKHICDAGGHTAEMFRVMNELDRLKFAPRVYVVATTDKLGAIKSQQHEERWAGLEAATLRKDVEARVHYIARSREVGQSWVTSAVSTAWATFFAVYIVLKERPGLLLVNGPGTCLPLCVIAHAARCLQVLNTRIVFVESIARTKLLSLTGKIIYVCRMSDLFLVQWPSLGQQFCRSKCLGRVY